MKKLTFLISIYLIVSMPILAQSSVEFVSNLDPTPGAHYSDIWGYVDDSGREYGIFAGWDEIFIVDLLDPANPVVAASFPTPASIWHDMKVHENYLYTVTDQSGQGLQIVDLSGLPASATLVNTVSNEFSSAHNIFIDDGFAFVIGTSSGGMHILDLTDPVNPVQTAYYSASDYIHDVYVWDDTVVACAADSYDLVDITDKYNPFKISESFQIPGIYAHSGWMSEDKRYFIATEEFNVRDITVWDLQDRSTWELVVSSWQMPGNSLVHNLFVKGDYAHISYYNEGYVVLDISDPETPIFAAQYDTDPNNGDGAWGCYPYLPSGLTIISDRETGLYVLRFIPGDNAPAIIYTPVFTVVLHNDPVSISAQIVDDSEIADAKFYYRTVVGTSVGDWIMLSDDTPNGDIYEFEVPGQQHLTTVEYYFAAEDINGQVATLPAGGSGSNPVGHIPPPEFFSYQVIVAGTPVVNYFLPEFIDTTIVKGDVIQFSADVIDTTSLMISYNWYKNGTRASVNSTYNYHSILGVAPRSDTITVVASNGYNSVERTWYVNVEIPTSVNDGQIVTEYNLSQNYPNPFNPSTIINFSIPEAGYVTLKVFNLLGQEVATLVDGFKNSGNHSVNFDAADLSAGIYIAQIKANNFSKTIKMTLLK